MRHELFLFKRDPSRAVVEDVQELVMGWWREGEYVPAATTETEGVEDAFARFHAVFYGGLHRKQEEYGIKLSSLFVNGDEIVRPVSPIKLGDVIVTEQGFIYLLDARHMVSWVGLDAVRDLRWQALQTRKDLAWRKRILEEIKTTSSSSG